DRQGFRIRQRIEREHRRGEIQNKDRGDTRPLIAEDIRDEESHEISADEDRDRAQQKQREERIVDEEVDQSSQRDVQRIAGWFRLLLHRIERQQRASESNLFALPERQRPRENTREENDGGRDRDSRANHFVERS